MRVIPAEMKPEGVWRVVDAAELFWNSEKWRMQRDKAGKKRCDAQMHRTIPLPHSVNMRANPYPLDRLNLARSFINRHRILNGALPRPTVFFIAHVIVIHERDQLHVEKPIFENVNSYILGNFVLEDMYPLERGLQFLLS